MTHAQIISKASALGLWYHEIELVPGYVTKSCMEGSRSQWSQILSAMNQVDYHDKTVIDIGTMDGKWAFEAEKRGAKTVIATDIYQHPNRPAMYGTICYQRFMLAKTALNSNVIYVPGGDVESTDVFQFALKAFNEGRPPDIIQCFGVLYHVKNPILALDNMRSLLHVGGRLFLETAVSKDKTASQMTCNFDQSVYADSTTYWIPTVKCLSQMLILSCFKELFTSVLVQPSANRVCILAQAT